MKSHTLGQPLHREWVYQPRECESGHNQKRSFRETMMLVLETENKQQQESRSLTLSLIQKMPSIIKMLKISSVVTYLGNAIWNEGLRFNNEQYC